MSRFLDALDKVDEINWEIGLSRVVGMEEIYQITIGFFHESLLFECNNMESCLNDGDITGFSTLIHGMKSELATIGAMSLSEVALKLETASKNNEADYCQEQFPDFKERLLTLNEQLDAAALEVDKV